MTYYTLDTEWGFVDLVAVRQVLDGNNAYLSRADKDYLKHVHGADHTAVRHLRYGHNARVTDRSGRWQELETQSKELPEGVGFMPVKPGPEGGHPYRDATTVAQHLRETPGQWFVIMAGLHKNTAMYHRQRLATGHYAAFNPVGDYQFATRLNRVYGRYLGEN